MLSGHHHLKNHSHIIVKKRNKKNIGITMKIDDFFNNLIPLISALLAVIILILKGCTL